MDAGGVLLHPHRGRASALHRVHATPHRVILSKAKDLKSASWCIQILHSVQNDNKRAIKGGIKWSMVDWSDSHKKMRHLKK